MLVQQLEQLFFGCDSDLLDRADRHIDSITSKVDADNDDIDTDDGDDIGADDHCSNDRGNDSCSDRGNDSCSDRGNDSCSDDDDRSYDNRDDNSRRRVDSSATSLDVDAFRDFAIDFKWSPCV
jgi:hypothetical protein